MPNYIKRIGLELEGGWRSRPNCELHRDSSVEVRADYVGEASSPPYAHVANAEAWLRRFHPPIVNGSCGFHIHISVDPGYYCLLMCRSFYDAYIEAYRAWAMRVFPNGPINDNAIRFFDRFSGDNRYCAGVFDPDSQTTTVNRQSGTWDNRYRQLNFCWAMHGTLESRLLPMFSDVELSVGGMHVFLNVVNTWLEQAIARPEQGMEARLDEGDGLTMEPELVRLPDITGVEPHPLAAGVSPITDYHSFLRTILPQVFRDAPTPDYSELH